MHFCSNLLPVALLPLVALFFLFCDPLPTQGADQNVVTAADFSQKTISGYTSTSKSQISRTRDGLIVGDEFLIKRPSMGMALTYEYKDEARTTSGTTVKDSYHRLKERVKFVTSGWVYHPALMKYSLMVEPEWIQSQEKREPDEAVKVNAFSPDYALTTTFLQEKPFTLDIFASRREYPIWAAFAGSTESVTETYGSNVRLKYSILPATVGYSHKQTVQNGYYTSQNIRDDYHLTTRHQNERSNTALTSTYSDDKRTTEGITTQINTFNNDLTNNWQITGDNRIQLHSSLNYRFQETDSVKTANFRLKEMVNWKHSENLRSNYSFTHDRQNSGDLKTDRTSFDANLSHLLYENLTTDIGSRVNLYNYSDGNENAFDTHLDFSYTRSFSKGTLNLNTGWIYLYTRRTGSSNSIAPVNNELHTLGPTQETYLDNYNVAPDSIIVTNVPGTVVYIENIDYTVDVINGFTRINYLPFGAITAGQSIVVTYRYLLELAYDDGLLTQNYGFNTTLFNDWQVSYNYILSRQNILSGDPPDKLIDDSIQRGRIRYNVRWSDTSLNYEDNNRQSSRAYTRYEIMETLNYRPQWQMYLALKGYLGQTTYKDNEELKEFYGAVTTFDWLLTRWCKFHLEGYYDSTKGDLEETANSGAKAEFEFRYHIWKARLSYNFTDQNNITTEYRRREQLFRFEILRIMW